MAPLLPLFEAPFRLNTATIKSATISMTLPDEVWGPEDLPSNYSKYQVTTYIIEFLSDSFD